MGDLPLVRRTGAPHWGDLWDPRHFKLGRFKLEGSGQKIGPWGAGNAAPPPIVAALLLPDECPRHCADPPRIHPGVHLADVGSHRIDIACRREGRE